MRAWLKSTEEMPMLSSLSTIRRPDQLQESLKVPGDPCMGLVSMAASSEGNIDGKLCRYLNSRLTSFPFHFFQTSRDCFQPSSGCGKPWKDF